MHRTPVQRPGGGYGQQQQPRSRGPGPMLANPQQPNPHQQQLSQQAIAQQQQQIQHEREMAKRRAKRPTDLTIPEEVADVAPNVLTYRQMHDLERRLDAAVMRKRLDIQDAVNRNVKNQKTLRVFVSNTAKDQPWQVQHRPLDENAFDFETGQIPTFRVRIEGRLLDDEEADASLNNPDSDLDLDLGGTTQKEKADPPNPKFSHFFKQIQVELDRSKDLHPDGHVIEWRKPAAGAQPGIQPATGLQAPTEFDGFEFERKGDDSLQCTIRLTRDEPPDLFRLAPGLSQLLDTKEDTRPGVVMKIWEYVRVNGLQDPSERRQINCDEALKRIFGQDILYFPAIPDLTLQHIQPLEPTVIHYTIRTDVHSYVSPTVYDIKVSVEDPTRRHMAHILNTPQNMQVQREISSINDQIALLVQHLHHSKAKHDFWTSMAEDPASFVKRWVQSQKRDLDTLMGETRTLEIEEVRTREFAEKVRDHAYLLLSRQGR